MIILLVLFGLSQHFAHCRLKCCLQKRIKLFTVFGALQCADLSSFGPAVIYFCLTPKYFCLDICTLGLSSDLQTYRTPAINYSLRCHSLELCTSLLPSVWNKDSTLPGLEEYPTNNPTANMCVPKHSLPNKIVEWKCSHLILSMLQEPLIQWWCCMHIHTHRVAVKTERERERDSFTLIIHARIVHLFS